MAGVSGELEYLGRRDEQVKYHGYRVELEEVRRVVNSHPQVRDSVVQVKSDVGGEVVMVCYYVSRQEVEAGELREWVGRELIAETVPGMWKHLRKLPLTVNGKVNKEALPGVGELRAELSGGSEEEERERSEVEEGVVKIWREVLGVERVGVGDNFFELGGHSLLATQVVTRVRERWGIEMGLRKMFERPTVGGIGEWIEEELSQGEPGGRKAGERMERVARDGELPLSFAQQRLWFLDQLQPGSAAYNIPAAVRLTGRLDVGALEQTFTAIIGRHEVLRTTFSSLSGRPHQVIHPAFQVVIPILDLRAMPAGKRETEVRRLVAAAGQEAFDLETGPLLRLQVVRESASEHVLLLTMHHIISDGWSIGVLVREVAQLYEGYVNGEARVLPELPIQYADFAAWQRARLQGETLDLQLPYWRKKLAGARHELTLPMSRSRPALQTSIEATQSFLLPADLSPALKDLAQRENVTLFMIALAAWKSLLSHYSKQHDIVVGTDIANRNRRETEGLIGFFVNQLVLRTDLSGDPSFHELLERVREVTLGAYAHQDLPFEKLVEELNPDRALHSTPLFHVKLVLQNAPIGSLELPGLTFSALPVKTTTAKCDLTLTVWETAEGLAGAFAYNTDILSPVAVTRMVRDFNTILSTAIVQPEIKLSALADTILKENGKFRLLKGHELQEVGLRKLKNIKRKPGSLLRTETGVGL